METTSEPLVNGIEVEGIPGGVDELLGSINSSPDPKAKEEEKLRRKLRFYYMNPIEKWEHKQRFPYKFFVQLIKIIVVTLQSCLFAHHRTAYVDFVLNNKVAFSHLFLQGWDSSREVISYPPSAGDLALYKMSDFYSAIDFAVINYANLNDAVGLYSCTDENDMIYPMQFCYHHYKICDIFHSNVSYEFNNVIMVKCINIPIEKGLSQNFSSKEFFRKNKFDINFPALVEADLLFNVKTVNLKPAGPKASPDCFKFNLTLVFDNHAHDGKIKLGLDMSIYKLHCQGTVMYESDNQMESLLHSLLNSVVIVFCLISCILCSRAIYRAQLLRRKTVEFFKKYHNKVLTLKDRLEFVNMWYVTMITSDFIVIVGSGLKQRIEQSEFSGDEWNTCSAMLGGGTFLIWFCVLRYFGFFETYNVVVLTLKVATPMILRYMVCTALIYAGFVFCGWLVLGPYHTKFRTLSITTECLFALINGDDVFATFSILEPTKSSLIWWFCKIYLYFFISLFIYVILSLFVSVILDAYETIKRYYVEGFPKNEIQEFLDGGLYRGILSESSSTLGEDLPECCTRSNWFSSTIRMIFCWNIVKGCRQQPESHGRISQ